MRRLIHDDSPASELRSRTKKLAEVLRHPLYGLPVAFFSALLVFEDAHRDDLVFPISRYQHGIRDEARRGPDYGHELFLHPPEHLIDGGGLCLVIAYSREHVSSAPFRLARAVGCLCHCVDMMAPDEMRRELLRICLPRTPV